MGGIMLDSTDPAPVLEAIRAKRTWRNMAIRAGAGYIDGAVSAWPSAAFTALRATGVVAVEITVAGAAGADWGDVENGDLNPVTGAEWIDEEIKAGRRPEGLYVNRSNKAQTRQECVNRGRTPGRDFMWWVATLDGSFTDTDGSDMRDDPTIAAIQFASAQMLGIDADASVITTAGNKLFNLAPTWEEHALELAGQLRDILKAHQ